MRLPAPEHFEGLDATRDPQEQVATLVEQARGWLAQAVDIAQVGEVRARDDALATYLKAQISSSTQAVVRATEIRLRAERRLGEPLAEQPKALAGRPEAGEAPAGAEYFPDPDVLTRHDRP